MEGSGIAIPYDTASKPTNGLPLAVYADKHTTYKSPAEPTVDEQLEGQQPRSQFARSLAELGVELIYAHSPQAKGRVERLFGTFQDRVIKELRLAGSATLEAANGFLETYLPAYNQRLRCTLAFQLPRAWGTPPNPMLRHYTYYLVGIVDGFQAMPTVTTYFLIMPIMSSIKLMHGGFGVMQYFVLALMAEFFQLLVGYVIPLRNMQLKVVVAIPFNPDRRVIT